MKKGALIALIIILIIAIGGIVYFVWLGNSENRTTSFIIPDVLEPFIRIEKNEEMSSKNLSLNGENREMYYYFDIFNYDEISEEYSTLDITPYVKIGIKQNSIDELDNSNADGDYVSINLYYIKDFALGLQEENVEEITTKGEPDSGYEEYYECKRLYKYDEKNESNNVAHYVAKITLNAENEDYNNLTANITQKLEIILGYRK